MQGLSPWTDTAGASCPSSLSLKPCITPSRARAPGRRVNWSSRSPDHHTGQRTRSTRQPSLRHLPCWEEVGSASSGARPPEERCGQHSLGLAPHSGGHDLGALWWQHAPDYSLSTSIPLTCFRAARRQVPLWNWEGIFPLFRLWWW